MKRELLKQYKGRARVKDICQWIGLPRSSGYYKLSGGKRGAKPSTHTLKRNSVPVSNEDVVKILLEDVFSQEFNLYGYRLSTEELREMGFIINHKKVYRLLRENGLLLKQVKGQRSDRQWVKWRVIKNAKPLEHICMDIKYVYVHGHKRNAYLLAIMDVATRYVLGWSLCYSMKYTDVILCLHGALRGYATKNIMLRTDNGSQFIACGLKKYLESMKITQEFTHVSTPQENSYIESLFSCVEREVTGRYEIENLYEGRARFSRYFSYYNLKRKKHALGRMSPINYWNTVFHSHSIKPPKALSEEIVKGDDDTLKINSDSSSSLALPLTISERGLSLINKNENMSKTTFKNLSSL
ncbi:MAG TPA: IS3 family transposase [Flavobacterium sp.]|nr:IS3 family transposase [Flavobacterium sp.]